jgi:hypothetical protein
MDDFLQYQWTNGRASANERERKETAGRSIIPKESSRG